MIDLHTHTTASDGRCTPAELVARAQGAGITVLSVTDHDTTGGCAAAARGCAEAGIEFVPGIEITSIVDGVDVHVLGYFIDVASSDFAAFLAAQRRQREARVRSMIARLTAFGITLDAEAILRPAQGNASTAVGRPWVARALVAGGYVGTTDEAFDKWLARGRPAFVPRGGPSPAEVFERIHAVGGIASLAHPALVRKDAWIESFARSGLDALEAYHSEHDALATRHYLELARRLNLAVSGGSDYHADETHGSVELGEVSLPPDAYERLKRLRKSA